MPCGFLRGLTDHCFCLSGIPPRHSPQATSFRLSVSCQPLLSRSNARGCLQNALRSDNSATLNFRPLVIGLFRFSDLWTSLFRLKEHIVEDDATLLRWHVKNINFCDCLFTECGKTDRLQSNHACVKASSEVARCILSEFRMKVL